MTVQYPEQVLETAADILKTAREKKLRLVIAESCTGGLLTGCLTEVPGSSDVLDRGFIVYSNDSKMQHLDVSRKTLADYGEVSGETALEMAEGALMASHADMSVAITGIAGPGGGSEEKPVGLVYIAVGNKKTDHTTVLKNNFTGNRSEVRYQSIETALAALKEEIDNA